MSTCIWNPGRKLAAHRAALAITPFMPATGLSWRDRLTKIVCGLDVTGGSRERLRAVGARDWWHNVWRRPFQRAGQMGCRQMTFGSSQSRAVAAVPESHLA